MTLSIVAPPAGYDTGSAPIVRYTLTWNEGMGGLLSNERSGDVTFGNPVEATLDGLVEGRTCLRALQPRLLWHS